MSTEKILRPKTMRRGILALLLVAPLVYMFGSLFFALNGAHEGFPFGNEERIILVESRDFTNSYTLDISNGEIIPQGGQMVTDFYTIDYLDSIDIQYTLQHSYRVCFYDEEYNFLTGYNQTANNTIYNVVINFASSFCRLSVVKEDFSFIQFNYLSNSSDYLFGQFFAKDNWVSSLGERTLAGENVYGFTAFSDLVRYADENAFNIGDSDWGKFLYGYATYAVNTLIIYELIAIGVSLLMIPLRITDWFGNKGGFDL